MWHSFVVIITVLKQEPRVSFVLFLLSVDETGVSLTVTGLFGDTESSFSKKAK